MARVRNREVLRETYPWIHSATISGSQSRYESGTLIFKDFQSTTDDQGLGLYGKQYLYARKQVRRCQRIIRDSKESWRVRHAREYLPRYLSIADMYQRSNSGGGFLSRTETHSLLAPTVSLQRTLPGSLVVTFDGTLSPYVPSSSPDWSRLKVTGSDLLNIEGARAIAATRPTKAGANVGTMIAELKQGLPQMLGRAIAKHGIGPRSVADEHLNYQFGIAPLVSDLNDLVVAFERSDQRWSQLVRDSGRRIRRRLDLGTTTTSLSETDNQVLVPAVGTTDFYSLSSSKRRTTQKVTRHRWFSGAYRYIIPSSLDPFSRFRREAAKWRMLYGADLSIATVYELAPWSWLFEWFGNLQNALSNAVALTRDDLVLEYGYVMEHSRLERVHDLNVSLFGYGPYHAQYVRTQECKYRIPANPYGFGLNYEGLSTRQLSILAALGITKGSRQAILP